jgi:hypothetical protein
MLYSVYAVFGVISSVRNGEMESDDLTSYSEGMVALRTRKRGMRADGEHHQKRQGLGEFRIQVNSPSPEQHIQGPIRLVITAILCLPLPIR